MKTLRNCLWIFFISATLISQDVEHQRVVLKFREYQFTEQQKLKPSIAILPKHKSLLVEKYNSQDVPYGYLVIGGTKLGITDGDGNTHYKEL